jgi:hypothetical protein
LVPRVHTTIVAEFRDFLQGGHRFGRLGWAAGRRGIYFPGAEGAAPPMKAGLL